MLSVSQWRKKRPNDRDQGKDQTLEADAKILALTTGVAAFISPMLPLYSGKM